MVKKNPKKQKGLLQRFWNYKYSGLLTFPTVIGLIVILWIGVMSQMEFYDNFTCDGLVIYKINNVPLDDNPTYNELSDESKERYDTILNECAIDGVWRYHDVLVLDPQHQQILTNQITIDGTPDNPLQATGSDFG